MERLKYQKIKGLEIHCTKCGKTITKSKAPFNGCKHPLDKTKYRAIIYILNSGCKRIVKTLKARTYNEAVKELLELRKLIEDEKKNKENDEKRKKSIYFKDCISLYMDFLKDINIPNHLKKDNSKRYISNVYCNINNFNKFLEQKKINSNLFKVTDINDIMTGEYFDFLLKLSVSNYTFNNNLKAMRSFFTYLIEKENYIIINYFKNIKTRKIKDTNKTIVAKDFLDLIKIISPDNSIVKVGKTNKNMYRNWLVNAIKLKAYTGRRNNEIFNMKWKMIEWEDDKPIYIASPNIKVNKLNNHKKESEMDVIYIPIIEELEKLLFELEIYQKIDNDEYIIAPDEKNREILIEKASKSFTFYFKKLERNYSVQMKELRSTYITAQEIYSLRKMQTIDQHANFSITNKHYINQKEIAKFITLDRTEFKFKIYT